MEMELCTAWDVKHNCAVAVCKSLLAGGNIESQIAVSKQVNRNNFASIA